MPKPKPNQVGKIETKTGWLWFLVGWFGYNQKPINIPRYHCAGHQDNQGHQNHPGIHNQVWGPRRLKLCTRAHICPFNIWCHRGVLLDEHSLGSRQKKHVKRCVKKWVVRRVRVLTGEEGGQPNVLPPSPVLPPALADLPGNLVPEMPPLPPLGHAANPIVLVSYSSLWV